jgi:phosphatidylserine/phosphatidylglycerophosphate/cardiolipin synthase-like enzyme
MLISSVFSNSSLFNENTFYPKFIHDLENCQCEVIIESPFITIARTKTLLSIFEKLLEKEVKIYIFTRDPRSHASTMSTQAEAVIRKFEYLGIQTFILKSTHHRKLAIIDRHILWEGSLNILSQRDSQELMRRVGDSSICKRLFNFIGYQKVIS